ncbi:MAG: multiheme c-type cytochrome [Planctomycetota bacterium]
MSFKSVFIAITISTALIVAALLLNAARPPRDLAQPGPEFVRATGKCAECHRHETSAIVHEFEASAHSRSGVTCFDCHRAQPGQAPVDHNGFQLATRPTALSCKQCHATEYEQYLRSRHAAPAWAAVRGAQDFTPAQVAQAERSNPGAVARPPNQLAVAEGASALQAGCAGCHSIGKPNPDGSLGTCTECHSRHSTSVALARRPETCGQCHMGPDHSQLEIYSESKHGALFAAQASRMNLEARPKALTTRDMPVPTCATCHMSGLEGLKVTHDPGERLSWFLFADVSARRPDHARAQAEMQEVCTKCHAASSVKAFYAQAEQVVAATNDKVRAAQEVMTTLRKDGLLTPAPFDEPIEFLAFDLWHYFGRTAKHGAFMGGADFVQWHGNYELLHLDARLRTEARELREAAARRGERPR